MIYNSQQFSHGRHPTI